MDHLIKFYSFLLNRDHAMDLLNLKLAPVPCATSKWSLRILVAEWKLKESFAKMYIAETHQTYFKSTTCTMKDTYETLFMRMSKLAKASAC